jgi:aminoglycoside phosphotransferase (APT) family kinase protein
MPDPIVTALEVELTRWLGSPARLSGTPARLTGGESADCYRLEIPGHPATLVLRLQHDDRAAARECAIQRTAAEAGFPAPRVLFSGNSASAFGRPFTIMAFMEGRDPVKDRSLRAVPAIFAETMLQLHALDPDKARTALATAGVEEAEAGIPATLAALRASRDTNIATAAGWLAPQAPVAAPLVICHGDLHGFNLLLRDGRTVAVLDWELATLAPREYDVARTETLSVLMPGVGPAAVRGLLRWIGARLARRFVAAYEAQVRLDRNVLDFCRALHALRLIAIARTPSSAPARVHRLWRSLEPVLSRRWSRVTGREI